MNAKVRLVAALLALLRPGAALTNWLHGSNSTSQVFEPSRVPHQLGPYWAGLDTKLDEEILAMLQPELYLMRLYRHGDVGSLIWSYIAVYRGRGTGSAHDPEICYPAQGWDIMGRQNLEIEMDGGGVLTTTLLRADKDGRGQLVLYWFQPVGRWPTRPWLEQVLRIYDSIRGSTAHAFVRLSTPESTGSRSQELLIDFARLIGPKIWEGLDVAAIPHPAKRDE